MEINQAARRTTDKVASVHPATTQITTVVRQAILLQACVGTLGAVEYLKAHEVDSQVINRVLSGGAMREEDRLPISTLA